MGQEEEQKEEKNRGNFCEGGGGFCPYESGGANSGNISNKRREKKEFRKEGGG